ncbi:MAG: hypothetical protein R3F65_08095 [bacterium]|nr:hypothetical protein [Myxococcales bacterium]
MIRPVSIGVLALALAGCPSKVKGEGEAMEAKVEVTSAFDRARQAFAAFVGGEVGLPAAEVSVVPLSEPLAAKWKVPAGRDKIDPRIGGAWAFEAGRRGDPPAQMVRGWATADGVVITRERNLGRLVREAGPWDAAPRVGVEGLVARLVWSMGAPHRVAASPVVVERSPEGRGTVAFATEITAPGGPSRQVRFVLHLDGGEGATLEALPR